jgi:cytoskeletal protein CcmA (bactofilin family)
MSQITDTSGTLPTTGLASGRSHFTAGSKLTGDLQVPGLVELLGHVDGKVTADAIMIEESGSVDGELHAARIAIKGQFKGKIFGGTVNLHSSARVSGEIFYEALSIESGAQVNSACKVKKPA